MMNKQNFLEEDYKKFYNECNPSKILTQILLAPVMLIGLGIIGILIVPFVLVSAIKFKK